MKLTEPFLALIISIIILLPTYLLGDKVFQGVSDITKLSVGAYWGYTRQDNEGKGKEDKD